MPVNLGGLVATAHGVAVRVGVATSVVITRPAPAPNPLTGVQSGIATTQSATAVQVTAQRIGKAADATWSQARVILSIPANGLTFVPVQGDVVAFAGKSMRCTAVDVFTPAGTAISYFLALGG